MGKRVLTVDEGELRRQMVPRDHEKNVYACMVPGGLTSGKAF